MIDYSRYTPRELAELRILEQDAEPPYEAPCTGYNPHQTERLADGISERQRWLLALDTIKFLLRRKSDD